MDLKNKVLEKIARQLKNLGCDYMIVPDGDAGKALTNGNFHYHKKAQYGEYTAYVASYAHNLQPGESVVIPTGDYSPTALRSATSAYAFRTFGKGNFASCLTTDGKGVELLCLDRDSDLSDQIADLLNEETN